MFFLKELPSREVLEAYAKDFPDMDVDAIDDALSMMRRASLLIRRLESYFAVHDLSQLRFLTLIVIDREPDRDGLMASEIADRLDVSRPVTTRTLQGLAQAGLIKISDDEGDRRARCVRLTRKGKAKLSAVLPGYYREINAFMGSDESTQPASRKSARA